MEKVSRLEQENKEVKSLIWILSGGLGCLALIVIVILASGYFLWKSIPTAEEKVDEFETALEEEDADKLLDILEPEDQNMNMDEHGMHAFIDYFNEVDQDKKEMLAHLSEQADDNKLGIDENYFVHLEKNHNRFFTSKYELVVSPVYFRFELYYPGGEVYLNDELVHKTDDQEEHESDRIGPFVPGKYTFVAEHDSPVKTFTAESDVTVPLQTSREQELITFDFGNWKSISLYQYDANLEKYKLFLEGEDTGEVLTMDNPFVHIDPESSDLKAYLEGDFPWGTMKSEEIELAEGSDHNKPRFFAEGDMQQEIIDVLKAYHEKKPEFIAEMDKDYISPYTTKNTANKLQRKVEELKEDGQHYRGKFIELEYFPETMVAHKSIDSEYVVLVVVREHVEEGTSKKKKPDMEKQDNLLMYELSYDDKEWLIKGPGDHDSIDFFFPDIDFDKAKSEQYKAENLKTYLSDW